jgi:HKD family nuclease
MHSIRLITQDSDRGQPSGIINALSSLSAAAAFTHLRVAVAYATSAGCRELCKAFALHLQNWRTIKKEWLIGVDQGITEPDALRLLLSQRNSKIRVPDGQRLLRQKCRSINRFHPKTFVFDAQEAGTEQPFGVFLGSANLTFSGLHSGTEHGTSILWHPPFNTQDKKLLDSTIASLEWWNRAWEEADIVADSFIEKYREIRPQRIMTEDDNELVKMFSAVGKQLVEIQEGIGWATSRCFWIETHELYKNLGATRPGM